MRGHVRIGGRAELKSSGQTVEMGYGARFLIELACGLFWVCFFGHPLFSTTWLGLFLGLFFPQELIFNNFPALFLGLFGFVFQARSFIFNNFSGLFLK
jgi:hypothetical protein